MFLDILVKDFRWYENRIEKEEMVEKDFENNTYRVYIVLINDVM